MRLINPALGKCNEEALEPLKACSVDAIVFLFRNTSVWSIDAMSGLEIAGVVLGSIPLLISALEHYQQGIRTVQRWLKYDREIRCLIRNLKSENCKLENVCEKLLIGLVPDHCIEAMVAKPFGELWQDKDIQDKVRSRLWRSFSVFERTVQDMNASVEEMKEKLGAGAEVSLPSVYPATLC